MTAFEDFVVANLPLRPAQLTFLETSHDADPNVGAPPILIGAAIGTLFHELTADIFWKKNGAGVWEIGGGGGGGGGPLVIQTLESGFTEGTVEVGVKAGIAVGHHRVSTPGTALIKSENTFDGGTLALGTCKSTGLIDSKIQALGRGSQAIGYCQSESYGGVIDTVELAIQAEGEGSRANGMIRHASNLALEQPNTSGKIIASGDGSTAQGRCEMVNSGFGNPVGECLIEATGFGSVAQGYARIFYAAGGTPGATATIQATRSGALASGSCQSDNSGLDSLMWASGEGATCYGSAAAGGTIEADGTGGFAQGSVSGDGARLETDGNGASAVGLVSGVGAILRAVENAAVAQGNVGVGGLINSSGQASQATGDAIGALSILNATGFSSIARGLALAGFEIQSTATCSHAEGYASAFNILANARCAFALGRADTAAIEATAENAWQMGPGTNNTALSMQIGGFAGAFMAKGNGQFAGQNRAITLGVAAVTFATISNCMSITGDAGANVIATIAGGISGQEMSLIFRDGLVTLTDDGTGTADTINLSAAFVSAAGTVLKLLFDGTSWYEVSRSSN